MPKLRASAARTVLARGRAKLSRLRSGTGVSTATRVSELEAQLAELDGRIAHVESVVEGLQDAVFRQSVRRDELSTEVNRRTDPSEIARALSHDARRARAMSHRVRNQTETSFRRSSGTDDRTPAQVRPVNRNRPMSRSGQGVG